MINTWTCAPNPAANHHRRVDTVSLTSCKITKNYLVRHYQLYNVYIFLTAISSICLKPRQYPCQSR